MKIHYRLILHRYLLIFVRSIQKTVLLMYFTLIYVHIIINFYINHTQYFSHTIYNTAFIKKNVFRVLTFLRYLFQTACTSCKTIKQNKKEQKQSQKRNDK